MKKIHFTLKNVPGKIRNGLNALGNLCVKVTTDRSVSFCRNPETEPHRSYRTNETKTIRLADFVKAVLFAFAAAVSVIIFLCTVFTLAVRKKSSGR